MILQDIQQLILQYLKVQVTIYPTINFSSLADSLLSYTPLQYMLKKLIKWVH